MTNDKKPREWWIEFSGDPSFDNDRLRRFVSGKNMGIMDLGETTIHVIEKSAYDKLLVEIERLTKVIAKEFNENDELGTEYIYVNILREENARLRKALEQK